MSRPKRTTLSAKNLIKRGVPKALHNCTLDDLDTFGIDERTQAIEYIKDYINHLEDNFNDNHGLLIYGSNGVGKSFIASLITKYAYINRYTSKRCTYMDYSNEVTRLWNCKDYNEREMLEENLYRDYQAVEFLVLEEVGKEIQNKVTVPILEGLLRFREERGLVTIICTNLSPKLLREQYGASIISLIKGNCTPIMITGKDLRQDIFDERTN